MEDGLSGVEERRGVNGDKRREGIEQKSGDRKENRRY